MAAPHQLLELVDRFDSNRDAYRSGAYNEAQARIEFIDPMFKLLGWDMANEAGYAEAYKDVVHEDSIKADGGTKSPDYCFRIGGSAKFFLEAKKPSVNLRDDISPAFQLRRYAWTLKLPLSVLTDFEEFAVYDCRSRPDKSDKASTARTFYVRYNEYAQRWDEIAAIFSREAILKGSFDKYAASTTAKRGTAEVDDVFLQEIESWRDVLARNIALRNPALTQRELNYAVQATIDRIIFLRICEGRGIEDYGRLLGLQNGNQVYSRLCGLFQSADERYNSGLFHFRAEKARTEAADELSLTLTIDDKPLKDIIKRLYYPDSPYEFSVLPADILGQVYEQFLGKVIRLTEGHHAVVEDKPEVKKAGGVYYTPTYIVEYIVENTVGKLLEGKTPRQVANLRVLDPACGSGSFLIVAYQRLLDWHLQWYAANEAQKWAVGRAPRIFQAAGGDWRLTTAERKRILLDHIFGVDIDPQAVEVTKLSLLLKVLEGENEHTLATQLRLFHERALPDLSNNIKCGNSLIGPDFYDNRQMGLLDEEERNRINVFDWKREFPQVFEQGAGDGVQGSGGFDVVIGNPPYVRQEALGDVKHYFEEHYRAFRPTSDLYVSFVEKALSLLRSTGLFGMIVSNKWIRAEYGRPLRELLTHECSVHEVVDLAGLPVFRHATVRTVILICGTSHNGVDSLSYLAPMPLDRFRTIHAGRDLEEYVLENSRKLMPSSLSGGAWALSGSARAALIARMRAEGVTLNHFTNGKPYFGVKTGFNQAFIVESSTRDALVRSDAASAAILKPLVGGRDIRRYTIEFAEKYLIWSYIGVPIESYPAVFKHLQQYERQLRARQDQGNHWWELRACDYYERFSQPKIVYPDIATTCRFTLDRDGYFASNTTYFIAESDTCLLGILNSALAFFYFSEVCAGLEGGGQTYLRFFGQYLESFPVCTPDLSDPAGKARHDQMVEMVERMLALHKQLAAAKTGFDKSTIQRQIEATDRQIDRLVYELYGLTEDEIAVVEAGV